MLLGTLGVSLIENLLDGNWINLDEYKLLQDNWIALNGNVNNVIPLIVLELSTSQKKLKN